MRALAEGAVVLWLSFRQKRLARFWTKRGLKGVAVQACFIRNGKRYSVGTYRNGKRIA